MATKILGTEITASATTAITGTTNYISKFSSGNAIGNSQIYDNGTNVGINIASPSTKLHVAFSDNAYGVTSTFENTNTGSSAAASISFKNASQNPFSIFQLNSGGDAGFYNTATSGKLNFFTNSSQRMTIDASGNVGVGTTSPTQLFHVYGGYGLIETAGGPSYLTFLKSGGVISQVGVSSGGNGYLEADNDITLNPGHSEVLRATTGGNVGIGTSSPGNKLHAVNSGYCFLTAEASGFGKINIGSTGGLGVIYTTDSNPIIIDPAAYFVINTDYTERMRINTSGNVGINTTDPSTTLDVQGTGRFGDNLQLTGSLNITGSQVITGSLRGNVSALSISSNTASVNMSSGNFFTLALVNGANTNINPTNIRPGQTVNIRVTQGSAGTGTVSFPSFVDQPSGSLYTGSAVANAIDIVTMVSFDSTTVFMSSVRNMI